MLAWPRLHSQLSVYTGVFLASRCEPQPCPFAGALGTSFLSDLWQHHMAYLVLMMQVELALQSVGLPGEPHHLPPTLSPDTR